MKLLPLTVLATLATALALLASACGEPAPTTAPTQIPTPTPSPTAEAAPDTDLEAIMGTTVLRPGSQRVSFLLTSSTALITAPEARVSTFFGAGSASVETATATFNLWPYGTRGSYTTDLSFDRPGLWTLEMEVDADDGSVSKARIEVDVTDGFGVVDVGSQAPASMNRVLSDATGIDRLTSSYDPDPDLYSTVIADALMMGKPTMVVFATPAFCTTATCGPQVETVSGLRAKRPDEATFIHVEIYENPHEVQGDLTRARTSPIMEEWGLTNIPDWTNESWVFVIDRDGRVTARFEAYTTSSELEAALLETLN